MIAPWFGRDAHLARHVRAPGLQQRQQMGDEREVAEVIGRELQFEPVVGQLPRRRAHDTGVVDQDVDRATLREEPVGERCDRFERRQIERVNTDAGTRRPLADARCCSLTLVEVADGHDDLGAGAGEAGSDLESDPVARAGHDGEASGEVGDGDVEGLRHDVQLHEFDEGCFHAVRSAERHSGRAYPGIADPWLRLG